MQEYYTHFSFILELTPKERRWLKTSYEELGELIELISTSEDTGIIEGRQTELIEKNFHKDSCYLWVPEMRLEDGAVHLYADPSQTQEGEIASTASWLSVFLRENNPERTILFTWSQGAGSAVPDVFGGGACLVTAEGWYTINTWDEDVLKNLQQQRTERAERQMQEGEKS